MGRRRTPSILAPAYRRLTVGIVLTVTFFATEELAVATALPVVLRHLGHIRLYGWAFSAFVLAQLASTVLAGRLTDRYGMAGPMAVGVVLFTAGLLVDGLAPSMAVVVLGRLVQGAGAGLLAVVTNVAVGRGYPVALRPRVYAALSTAWVVPGIVGPALAGVVAEDLGWRWVFLGVAPAVVATAALALPAVAQAERSGAAEAAAGAGTGGPGVGAAVALAAASALVLGGLGSRRPVVVAAAVAVGLALFVPSLRAVLPSRRLAPAERPLGAPLAAGLVANLAFFGAEAFLPLTLVTVHHRSPSVAGLSLTTAALTWTAGSWVQARVTARTGPRPLVSAGMALVAAGVVLVLALDWPGTWWWLGFVAWGTAGLGMGLTYATVSLVVLNAAGPGRQGGPVASLQALTTLGVALGTGLGGAALAWSVAAGAGRAPGLRVWDATAVVVALVGVVLGRALPARGTGPAPVAVPPAGGGTVVEPAP